jgi:TonB family protein
VTDAATRGPLADVQVYLVGARLGALTRQNGVFVVLNIPAGTYEVRAERVGLATVSRMVEIAEGAALEVNFEMNDQAALEEIVVTGTAGSARRRELEAQRAAGQTSARPEPRPSVTTLPASTGQLRDTPQYTPHTVKPRLQNTEEVQRALIRSYPPALRDAQISGTVVVWMFIDPNGVVDNAMVQTASGYADLDEAGLTVARTMRFTPAYNGEQIVPVWVSIPITFRVGSAARAQAQSAPQSSSNVAREIPTTRVAGRITGRVVDRSTGVPLNNVQVYVRGISLGALSKGEGTFTILSVPPGTYEVIAERIGLTRVSSQVTVPDAGVVEANFQLSSQAIGMAEILSDGSVGAAPAREALNPISDEVRARAAQVPENVGRFTPHSVRPELVNGSEVQAVMVREYPGELREAGIRGTAVVWLFIDANGAVENVKVQASSGYPALDDAAVTTARSMRFTPAYNRDQKVAVWVAIPITFRRS